MPITAEQYWGSSLAEIGDMLTGAMEREQREWQRTAWMTAHMLNISGKELKRDVTPAELLGKSRSREPVSGPASDMAVEELIRRQKVLEA